MERHICLMYVIRKILNIKILWMISEFMNEENVGLTVSDIST